MKYLSIKNLAVHQHYKNRNPPWIKLHRSAMSDYPFRCLRDASKAHLMLLWLLASAMENRIPYDLAFITEMVGATDAVDIEELVLQGFVEVSQDDGKPLALRKQIAPLEESRGKGKQRQKEAPSVNRFAFMADLRPVWFAAYRGELPKGSATILEPLVLKHGLPKVAANLKNFCAAHEAQFVNIHRFPSTFGTWDTPPVTLIGVGRDPTPEELKKAGIYLT